MGRPLLATILVVGVLAGYVLGWVVMETADAVRARGRGWGGGLVGACV